MWLYILFLRKSKTNLETVATYGHRGGATGLSTVSKYNHFPVRPVAAAILWQHVATEFFMPSLHTEKTLKVDLERESREEDFVTL